MSNISLKAIDNKWPTYDEDGLKNTSNIEVKQLVVRNDDTETATSISILKDVDENDFPDAKLEIKFGFNSDQGLQSRPLIIAMNNGRESYNSPNMKLILQCNESQTGYYQSKISIDERNIKFGYDKIDGISDDNACYIDTTTGIFHGGINVTGGAGFVKGYVKNGWPIHSYQSHGSSRAYKLMRLQASVNWYIWQSYNAGVWYQANNVDKALIFTTQTDDLSGFSHGGYIRYQANIADINFTGQHRCYSLQLQLYNICNNGLIVVMTGLYKNINSKYHYSNRKQNITIDDALPCVELATKNMDKKVFGVINLIENFDDTNRVYDKGSFGTFSEKQNGDSRIEILALGEGSVWVSSINGNFECGDYITTCTIPGYGMKQDDDICHSYTLGKITTDVNWETIENLIEVKVIETYTSNISVLKEYTCNIFDEIEQKYIESNISVYEIKEKEFNLVDSDGYPIYKQLTHNEEIKYDTELEIRYVNEYGIIINKNEYDDNVVNGIPSYKCAFVGCVYTSG
jgi:hypothetical protein